MDRSFFHKTIHLGKLSFLFGACSAMLVFGGGSNVWPDEFGDLPIDPSQLMIEQADPPIMEDAGPDYSVSLDLDAFYRDINTGSAMNPGNKVFAMDDHGALFELKAKLTDYIDQNDTCRWLVRIYSRQSSEKNDDGTRESEARIDELFAEAKNGFGFISLGKRRITWGHALAFNPVSVIVPARDPLDPKQETEGQPVFWGHAGSDRAYADVILTRDYDRDWNAEKNRWGARLGYVGSSYDVSLYYADGDSSGKDEFSPMLAGSFSSNLTAGITLYGEAAFFSENGRHYYDASGASDKKNHYEQGVLGSYIVLDPESFLSFCHGDANLTVEYYYNGKGYSEKERVNYYNTLENSSGPSFWTLLGDYIYTGMARHYGLIRYQNNFMEKWTTNLNVLAAADASIMTVLECQYNVSDYYSVKSGWRFTAGDGNSEFGNDLVSHMFDIEMKISF